MRTRIWAAAGLLACATSAFAGPNDASCEGEGRHLGGNRSYQVTLPSGSGHTISFQVLEPAEFKCADRGRGAHPLMLHGPGYSGSRSTSGFADYRKAGYTVISIDPRGFGAATGTVRVMDPQYEGQDLLRILDWAEENLDYLAWRHEGTGEFLARPAGTGVTSTAGGENLVVGAIGSSYGGGYQLLLTAVDPKRRMDALYPDITWHDLRYSLNPGDVIKTLWDVALSGLGEASGQTTVVQTRNPADDGQDPFIKETLARGAATNEFPRQGLDWFRYHSLSHWCAASGLPSMPYPLYQPDTVPLLDPLRSDNTPPRQANGRPGIGHLAVPASDRLARSYLRGMSVLLTQGMPDTLFNFNEAWWNYQCLSAAGADVKLMTHLSGHILPGQAPGNLSSGGLGGGAVGACGMTDVVGWFNSKLRPKDPDQKVQALDDVCFLLAGTDVVKLRGTSVLAPQPRLGLAGGERAGYTGRMVATPVPVPNGPLGVSTAAGALPVAVPLGTTEAAGVLAGLAFLDVVVSSVAGVNEMLPTCGDLRVPTVRVGCDSIIFAGIGMRAAGTQSWRLVDDQIQPLRGLGRHRVDLVGVAERLPAGTELALLLYGQHVQFFGAFSRDASIPAVNVTGHILLPLYGLQDGKPESALAPTVLKSNLPPADSDKDGIDDLVDNCRHKINPGQQDHDGDGLGNHCDSTPYGDDAPIDSDGDGVSDEFDLCPGTPAGRSVDPDGCPVTSASLSASPLAGDVTHGPLNVTFTANGSSSDPNAGTLTYTFYYGDGTHSPRQTSPVSTHAYAQGKAGQFQALVIVADEAGNSAVSDAVTITTTTTVTVEPSDTIVPRLVVDVDRSVAPVTALFDGSGSEAPAGAEFAFDFGDGTEVRRGLQRTVRHVYTTPGVYQATMRITHPRDASNVETSAATITVTAVQQTTAQLIVNPNRVKVGDPVQFDATHSIVAKDASIVSYTFNFGDGNSLTQTVAEMGAAAGRATHVYRRAGEYQPSVTVVDNEQQQSMARVQVKVGSGNGSGGGSTVGGQRKGGGALPLLSLLPLFGLILLRKRRVARR